MGAVWGMLPSIMFFLVALLGFSRHFSLTLVLPVSFGVWLTGAIIHQRFLG